jgi:hypothetical protein
MREIETQELRPAGKSCRAFYWAKEATSSVHVGSPAKRSRVAGGHNRGSLFPPLYFQEGSRARPLGQIASDDAAAATT